MNREGRLKKKKIEWRTTAGWMGRENYETFKGGQGKGKSTWRAEENTAVGGKEGGSERPT